MVHAGVGLEMTDVVIGSLRPLDLVLGFWPEQ
jgi:hypothetical protein